MDDERCNAFAYDLPTKKCSVQTCVHPNLYLEGSTKGYDFYVRVDVGESFSELLARSEFI